MALAHTRAPVIAALVSIFMAACRSASVQDASFVDQTDAGTIDALLDDVVTPAPDNPAEPLDACAALFGRPVALTGLSMDRCRPACGCGTDLFVPSDWPPERVNALRAWQLLDPPSELTADPYLSPPPAPRAAVCGVDVVDVVAHTYRLTTYDTMEAARAAGALVTHADACGVCSTLRDLAVYAEFTDLGQSVRQCGVRNMDLPGDIACLEALGFTRPCAQIWAYNTQNTRANCLTPCVAALSATYNLPDGGLNACLACDEQISGPIFKAVAGRTRRNTGIPNAICRPCNEVVRLEHAYPQ